MAGERRRKRLDRSIKVRTEGLYALACHRDILYLVGPRALLILILLCLPIPLDLYWKKVICSAGVYALLSISFDFLSNYVGLVCLGSAFFVGTAGYISGLFNYYFGWPSYLTVPFATLTGAIICTVLLLPCLRLRGVYFAIVSFMYPLFTVFNIIALGVFKSTEGISGLETFESYWTELYLILGAVLIALFAIRRLSKEDFGLILVAIKDNDQAVRASGVNVEARKTVAVFIAALLGCFGGAYLSHLYGWVGISLYSMDFSILPIAATVMGGGGTLAGPVIGAMILTPMSEALRGFGQLRVVLYCLILLGFMLYKPEGLMNFLERKYHQFERWEEV